MKKYYVYILSSDTGVLYIGFTGDFEKRIRQHKYGFYPGFSKRYECKKLVYFEEYQNPEDGIQREKQIKKWRREKKEILINKLNPEWKDLASDLD